ncbi:MAG TPA: 30S ribosomal protein S12 methylthiotransferase RimO [Phycisphaerae bacterium]|nr:30S ribosomal protein S12 methylthiotransferase RimO [Phycisphaerae bacterium]
MPRSTKNQSTQTDAPPIHSVAFVSLGCPKNLVDSEKMLGLLAEDGIAITPNHDDADAIIINTCGFLEASKTESLDVIREAIESKKRALEQGTGKRVIVAGCLVQRHKAQLLDAVPEVDALVGVFDRENIVKAVRGNQFEHLPEAGKNMGDYHAVTSFIHKPTKADIGKGYLESDRARLRLTPRHYAYLRVSEGCNQGCTFCTIPSIRGRMRSKPLPDILAEAEELLADGAFELNLIGQDTTSYGEDIGYNATGEGLSGMLKSLDKLVAKKAPGSWVRLMYAYPSCFTDDMIKTLADCRHVVKYIDMPLQHINDQILHTMRRKVTRNQIETLLQKLRKWVPGIALRTTFISGFPTETDAQHAELLQFIKDFQFENVGVFEFSPEPGTPAGRLHDTDAVAPEIASQRKEEIMLAQQKIVFQKNAAFVGHNLKVLIDEVDTKKKTAVARHPAQAPDIDGRVLLKKAAGLSPGELVSVKIEDYNYYDLVATPTETKKHEPRTTSQGPRPRLSLPVVGVVSTSVETKGKRR